MLKVLITGGDGLLAHGLRQSLPPHTTVHVLSRAEFDLTQPDLMARRLRELAPDVVLNTAAYNLVDRCEQERELSWAVNALGPARLGELCAERNCRLVHYGTDYVFDGEQREPYRESDPPRPLNHYGAGKLAGEQAVLRASPRHLVLRTSWLFGAHPTQAKSYVHTVLRVARAGQTLRATTDQCSVPTHAADLAVWTWELVQREAAGLLHAVNDGGVSRYDWTRQIVEAASAAGLLPAGIPVEPVLSSYFASTMRRPAYSVMSNAAAAERLGHPLGPWQPGLAATFQNLLVTGGPLRV